jgi:hypothetical protein
MPIRKSRCIPGLAKFLKEQKAWDDKWKIATSAS